MPEPSETRTQTHGVVAERAGIIETFGVTPRQARFLVLVMVHSGVFMGRQYAAFAGITHGRKVHDFVERLLARGLATAWRLAPSGRTRIFHVHHKAERFMPGGAAHGGGNHASGGSPRRWA